MCALDRSHKSFSFSTLGHRLRSMPMFLALVPFIAGVALADCYALPLWLVAGLFLLSVIVTVVVMPRKVVLGYVALSLALFGYLVAELRAPAEPIPYGEPLEMVVSVEGIPSQREGYRVADGRVERWRDAEQWHEVDCRVVLWLRADDISQGDRLTVLGKVMEHISRYPDYNDLMHRRGFVGGVGIDDSNILQMSHFEPADMQSQAIRKLDRYATDEASHATVVAMVAGSRHNIPTTLREAYSNTGIAHLLAVSGLHLGIVMMVVATLLIPLRLIHRGHRLAALLTIVAIWFYVVMSGASPSVVRAAVMLSVLLLSRAVSAHYNSINALAATAFVMLVYRPNYLFDVSFQLSVAAVVGIVVWGVPLMRAMRSWSWIASRLASLFIVGAVATFWTLPIISHGFGNMPIVGVVLTPFVMIYSYIIVIGGMLAVVLPNILAMPFAMAAEWAAYAQNGVVEWAASLPFAYADYAMPSWCVVIVYVLYAAITALYWAKNQKKVVTLPRYDYD